MWNILSWVFWYYLLQKGNTKLNNKIYMLLAFHTGYKTGPLGFSIIWLCDGGKVRQTNSLCLKIWNSVTPASQFCSFFLAVWITCEFKMAKRISTCKCKFPSVRLKPAGAFCKLLSKALPIRRQISQEVDFMNG